MRISDWSSDVCSSDLFAALAVELSDPQPSEADPDRRAGRGDRRLQHLRPVSERAAPRLLVRPRPDRRGGERRAGGAMVRPHPRLYRASRRQAADAAPPDPRMAGRERAGGVAGRSEEHTSELQSLMRISYAVFCLKK